MALFMTPETKEPLVESHTAEAIAKRSAEIVGVVLMLLAGLSALMIGSYTPDDPGIFHATDRAPQNLLGLPGAMTADGLHRAIGWTAWGLPLLAGVWGLRFLLHRGENRVLSRLIAAPFALAVGAVFMAAHSVPTVWNHDYGLGGLFGDAVLGGVLMALPGDLAQSLTGLNLSIKTLTLIFGGITISLALMALGVTWQELRQFGQVVASGIGSMFRGSKSAAQMAQVATERAMTKARDRQRSEPSIAGHPQLPAFSAVPVAEAFSPDDDAIMARITAAVAAHERGRDGEPIGMDMAELAKDMPDQDDYPIDALDLPPVHEPYAVPAPEAPAAPKVKAEAPKKIHRKSTRARAEEQPQLFGADKAGYENPPLALLSDPAGVVRHVLSTDALQENARMLENVLDDYGVKGEIVSVRPGPVVTMYELEPAPGLKASRVIGLADDIARSMSALAARVSTVPGRSVIGIELPNDNREMVLLREILSAASYGDTRMKLPLALGKDIAGEPVVANLAKMPHLLIAGTTGSGKSVAINTMILSLLYQLGPEDCRLIMIDPKMLELSVYDGIPHLLSPVVTDPKKAVVALKWVVGEMEERYRKMSKMGVRNIDGYNSRVKDALAKGEDFSRTVQTGFDDETGEPVFETETFTPEKMPYIVVIVDEMADLMMVAGKEIEACIQRLAQMARASGIHLIMATQRPSVDVITGTIKANFPTRISFQVTSKVDSRTILGEMGAEQLLGQGDMLYMAGGGKVTRVHGPFVSDEEVEEVVMHLKSLGAPEYVSGVLEGPAEEASSGIDEVLGLGGNTTGEDALYDQAVAIVAKDRKCSTSYIQRKLAIGYNKAARLVEQMEDEGVVSTANHVGKREVLVPER